MMEEKDLSQKVRIHKHNYAGEFGNVVLNPARRLLRELIANPGLFDVDECDGIIEAFASANQAQGRYEGLGYTVQEQLEKEVKEEIVSKINNNATLYRRILAKERNFKSTNLANLLSWADNHLDSLISKLNTIQYDDKGELKPISAFKFIHKVFEEEKYACSNKGEETFLYNFLGRDFQDVEVLVVPDGFRMCVIHNIIENIKKHAFPSSSKDCITTSQSGSLGVSRKKIGMPRGAIGALVGAAIGSMNGQLWGKNNDAISKSSHHKSTQENTVNVIFRQDPENINFVNIIIENNGKVFHGDVTEVFKRGVRGADSNGEGLGLFSAADYLTDPRIGGSIKMESTPEEEFTVRFIIKLPIYGKI